MPEYRKISKLFFEPKGTHDPAEAYTIMDVVTSADGSVAYAALQDVPAGTLLDDASYWMRVIDMSTTMTAMQTALAAFGSAAKAIGQRVKGEIATATGNPVTFLPDAGSLLDVTATFEPKQEGEGEPSPDNIRTIVGYKTLELTHTGKNLFGVSVVSSMTSRGITLSVLEDGSIVLNGTASGGNATFNINLLKPIPVGEYTVSLNNATATSDNNSYVQFRDSAGSVGLNAALGKDHRVATGALSRDATSVRILIKNGEIVNDYKLSIQVERGEATSYVPYFEKMYILSLGKTVYGGRFILADGELIQEWDLISEYAGESLPSEWVSDRDVYAAGTTPTIGAQVAYKMATPVSEYLSPLLVAAIDPEQENTLSGDGEIRVDYVKPLHVSIEERVAAAAAAMTNG